MSKFSTNSTVFPGKTQDLVSVKLGIFFKKTKKPVNLLLSSERTNNEEFNEEFNDVLNVTSKKILIEICTLE